jgi:hypothetical protein
MMTPQEIIDQIKLLPLEQQKKIKDSIPVNGSKENVKEVSEEEFLQLLYEEKIIGNIPNPDEYTDRDEAFEPVETKGRPTSEIIIEDRG